MLTCEGYKMFKGIMKIKPAIKEVFNLEGTWLFKPEYECWYCKGSSYPASICEVIVDNTK